MTEREKLILEINAFIHQHGMNDTNFSKLATGNVAFMHKLRRGDDLLLSTLDRVRSFMASYVQPSPKKTMRGRGRPALSVVAS